MSWRLVQRLIASRGGVVTHDALLCAAYGDDPEGGPLAATETIRVLLCKIRKKFAPGALRAVRGVGYSLDYAAVPADLKGRVDRAEVVLSLSAVDRDAFQRMRRLTLPDRAAS